MTDLVYAALLGERSWQDFLEQLKFLLPNGKAFLFFHDAAAGVGAFPLAAPVDPAVNDAYSTYYSRINPWMHGACVRPIGRVVRAEEMFAYEHLIKTEFYGDWLQPQELESGIGVTIVREKHCNFLLSILSAEASEADFDTAITTTQALVPHLQRAFDWYRRDERGAIGLFGGRGIGESVRVGILSVGPDRKIRMANDAAFRMLDSASEMSVDITGRLRCSDPAVMECIDAIFANWMRERHGAPPITFLLAKSEQRPPLRVTVICPPREHGASFFRGPECFLLIEDPAQDIEQAADEFAALHKLSAAEKRVAAGLAHGLSLDQIARHARISAHTARTQLKQVFAKTGLGRQTDISRHICLLAGRLVQRSSMLCQNGGTIGRPESDQYFRADDGSTMLQTGSPGVPKQRLES